MDCCFCYCFCWNGGKDVQVGRLCVHYSSRCSRCSLQYLTFSRRIFIIRRVLTQQFSHQRSRRVRRNYSENVCECSASILVREGTIEGTMMIIRTLCVYWQCVLAKVGRPLYYLQLRTQTFHPPRSLEDQEATLLGPRYCVVLCGARRLL